MKTSTRGSRFGSGKWRPKPCTGMRRGDSHGSQGTKQVRGGGMHVITLTAALTSMPHPQEPAVPSVRGTRHSRLRQRLALAAHTHHSAREPRACRRPLLPQRLLLHLHPGVQRAVRASGCLCARRRRRCAPGEHPPRVYTHQLPPLHPDVAGAAWTRGLIPGRFSGSWALPSAPVLRN